MTVDVKNGSRAAIVDAGELVMNDVQSALDLIATVSHEHNCDKIIVFKESICDDFFDLRTCLAGEILQKYSTYGARLAIVGDFDTLAENSRSLRDFIRECNRGSQIFFVPTKEEALERLHKLD